MIISCDSELGATTCIKSMCLQALLGCSQNSLCIMEANVSLANAGEIAPLDRKVCVEKSRRIPTPVAYDLMSLAI